MSCNPDNPVLVRADLLLALLRRGARTYRELREAGLYGDELRLAAQAIEESGRGRVQFGPYVTIARPRSKGCST
jgi:hypothetical protein